jgi:hypothetical protein
VRILSKFKDFYDGLARSDRERTPVYVRETIEEFVRPWGITFGGDLSRMTEFAPIGDAILAMPATRGRGDMWDLSLSPTAILFCGTLHYGYIVSESWLSSLGVERRFDPFEVRVPSTPKFLTFEQLVAEIESWAPTNPRAEKARESFLEGLDGTTGNIPGLLGSFHTFTRRGYRAWWEEHGRRTGDFGEIHRREKTPVLAFNEELARDQLLKVTKNPPLISLGFHKTMTPQDAWQKIDQYLSNQMAVQNDPLPLDDKYRRDAHGFDDKSFKQTAPGEKKARRAARKKP